MKRLAVTAAVAVAAIAGCGTSGSQSIPHVVALDDAVPATAEPDVTIPPITVPPAPPAGGAALHGAPVDASRTRAARASRSGSRSFDALARCESGGDPQAVGGGGRYHGAFQFSLATWRSLGYSGNPADHSYATQKAAAQKLVRRSGWSQFPSCSRR